MAGTTHPPRRPYAGLIHAAIVLWGVISLGSAVLALPVGVALALVNGVLAVVTHGMKRKLFIAFAIAGAIVCVALSLTLLTARF